MQRGLYAKGLDNEQRMEAHNIHKFQIWEETFMVWRPELMRALICKKANFSY